MIGIFDSGIGGLTVVKELFKQLPEYQIIYFGDTARTPYGTKSAETITRYAIEDAQFLLAHGANLIIVACNSASAVASEVLKNKFAKPVFEVITPAVEKAARETKNNRIGMIGTRATVNSGIYERMLKRINHRIQVFSRPAPLLVPLVEEGWISNPETKMIVKKYLYPLKKNQIDTLILGCTHYPLLKNLMQLKVGKVKLVDPAKETIAQVKKYLEDEPEVETSLEKGKRHQFFLSDVTPRFKEIAQNWLGQKIEIEKVNLG